MVVLSAGRGLARGRTPRPNALDIKTPTAVRGPPSSARAGGSPTIGCLLSGARLAGMVGTDGRRRGSDGAGAVLALVVAARRAAGEGEAVEAAHLLGDRLLGRQALHRAGAVEALDAAA